MRKDVKPVPDAVLGRPFPSLQAVGVGQVVRRLPKVEGLIAVLDGVVQSRNKVEGQKNTKSVNRLDDEEAWRSGEAVSLRAVRERVEYRSRLGRRRDTSPEETC